MSQYHNICACLTAILNSENAPQQERNQLLRYRYISRRVLLNNCSSQSPPLLAWLLWYYPDSNEYLCKAEFWNFTHLSFHLSPELVSHPPPQFNRVNFLRLVPGMPYLNRLRNATTLLRLQGPSCLGLELRLISLYSLSVTAWWVYEVKFRGEVIPSLRLVESVPRR